MKLLFKLAKPFLHSLDPEDAHKFTIKTLKYMPACGDVSADAMLRQNLFGLDFMHPLGLAAGFDKGADVMGPMLKLGMSHVEAGTVTVYPQDGNPRPRIFRDATHQAVINRMGFPNPGADVFFAQLRAWREAGHDGIVGVNIGKNKDSEDALGDYTRLAAQCLGLASYVAINISSPNTPGLRDLQNGDFVQRCVDGVRKRYGGPVLVKLAPDLNEEQVQDLAYAVLACAVDGVILTNTTLDRPVFLPVDFAAEKGGLSGVPLRDKAQTILHKFYSLTNGKVPLIGTGGIASARDAYERIRAGASLLQLYSAMVFQGPVVITDIVHGLPNLLRQDGFATIADAVGADHR